MAETSPTSLPTFERDAFRYLNLYKTDFVKVNDKLNDVNWDALFQLCSDALSGNSFIELLRLNVLQACLVQRKLLKKNHLERSRQSTKESATFLIGSAGSSMLGSKTSGYITHHQLRSNNLKTKSASSTLISKTRIIQSIRVKKN